MTVRAGTFAAGITALRQSLESASHRLSAISRRAPLSALAQHAHSVGRASRTHHREDRGGGIQPRALTVAGDGRSIGARTSRSGSATAQRYVNLSASDFGLVTRFAIAVTSTVPSARAGTCTVQLIVVEQMT